MTYDTIERELRLELTEARTEIERLTGLLKNSEMTVRELLANSGSCQERASHDRAHGLRPGTRPDHWAAERRDHETTIRHFDELMNEECL